MKALTVKQFEIFEFIKAFINEEGMAPTSSEIAEAFGVANNAAWEHVNALKKKGALNDRPGKMRSLRPVDGFIARIKP